MTEITGCLSNHPKSHLQCWSNQLWLRPRVTYRPFSEAEKIFRTVSPYLSKVWQSFFLYPACPVQTLWTLLVVKAWGVPCPKASSAKKKTNSKWSVFGAQHFLGNRSVLPGAIVSHQQNPKLFKCHLYFNAHLWRGWRLPICRIQFLCI